jgi:predicted small lipoprotein YifL
MLSWIAKAAAIIALFGLAACGSIYSEGPLYQASDGVAAYGADAARIELRYDPKAKPVKSRVVYTDGVYTHTLTSRRDGKNETWTFAETVVPAPALGEAMYIRQLATPRDDGGTFYRYDVMTGAGQRFATYDLICDMLSTDERAQFNMTPPPLPPDAPGLEPRENSYCFARSRADLEAALKLMVSRTKPRGVLKVKPRRRGLFGS